MNRGESALHATIRDSDGGPLVVDDDLRKGFPGMRYHEGMTLLDRVACGQGTAADLAAVAEQNAAWRRWQESPEGKAFLANDQIRQAGPETHDKQKQCNPALPASNG